MIEEDPDVAEAVRRLTPDQQLARKRRQFRAFDISLKKTPLPDHIQAVQDPFEVCMCVLLPGRRWFRWCRAGVLVIFAAVVVCWW